VRFEQLSDSPGTMDKRSLTERDICTKFILPAVKRAGWDEMSQVREEYAFTNGQIIVATAEAETASYRNQLKAILAEALAR
jgi:type I site-specific restriction endonuclease